MSCAAKFIHSHVYLEVQGHFKTELEALLSHLSDGNLVMIILGISQRKTSSIATTCRYALCVVAAALRGLLS